MKALIYTAVILCSICSVLLFAATFTIIHSGGLLTAGQLAATSFFMLSAALILAVPLFVSIAVGISHLSDKTKKK